MAFRVNNLFQTDPESFLSRTVLFVDKLNTVSMRSKQTHFIDLEMVGQHAHARTLNGLHQYEQDAPLVSYFLPSGGVLQLPREDPPQRFIFLPEFTRCRLLMSAQGDTNFQLQLEENLMGRTPPPDAAKYFDFISYWDYVTGHLVGIIRGTAVLYKTIGEPWTFAMQQIVGVPGSELVRQTFTRPIKF